jgi:F0F1-type ATP synthase assembly protein I
MNQTRFHVGVRFTIGFHVGVRFSSVYHRIFRGSPVFLSFFLRLGLGAATYEDLRQKQSSL